MTFKYSGYIPIYEYGDPDAQGSGTSFGVIVYSSLQDLYGFEPEAIDYFEIEGTVSIPNKSCGAV